MWKSCSFYVLIRLDAATAWKRSLFRRPRLVFAGIASWSRAAGHSAPSRPACDDRRNPRPPEQPRPSGDTRARYRLTVNPGSPPKFHDDPTCAARLVESATRLRGPDDMGSLAAARRTAAVHERIRRQVARFSRRGGPRSGSGTAAAETAGPLHRRLADSPEVSREHCVCTRGVCIDGYSPRDGCPVPKPSNERVRSGSGSVPTKHGCALTCAVRRPGASFGLLGGLRHAENKGFGACCPRLKSPDTSGHSHTSRSYLAEVRNRGSGVPAKERPSANVERERRFG